MNDDDADPPRTLTDVAAAREPVARGGDRPPAADDPYEILGEQGRGGLGVVLRVRDHRLGRTVAVKVLIDGNDTAMRRFEREAQLTARLQHPAIVPVHEAGRWPNGMPFYAMKLVSGRTLKAVMAERATLAERLALLPNVVAVAEAIAYAHNEDVIHRDLKPSNVLVGAFGETVVVDWGLAKDLRVEELSDGVPDDAYRTNATSGLTVSGSVMGTPSYMPPEQARGETVDKRADVYALGAMLYQLLAGVPPHTGDGTESVIASVLAGPPIPCGGLARGAPPELIAIVEKAMAREAAERYPDGKALADDLTRFQAGQLVSAHQYGRTSLLMRWIRLHRLAVVATAVALVVAGATGAISIRRILHERQAAEDARRVAEDRERDAEAARRDAEQQRNELILVQARSSLTTDPTESINWLKKYPLDESNWVAAETIAADAESRGVAAIKIDSRFSVTEIALSPDGRWAAVHRPGESVQVYETSSGRVVFRENVASGRPWGVFAVSPDGRWIVYATTPTTLSLHELGATSARALNLGSLQVDAATFLGDEATLFVHGLGETRICTTTSPLTCRQSPIGLGQQLFDVTASDDGGLVITQRVDGTMHLIDVDSSRERLDPDNFPYMALTFLPASRLVVAARSSGEVILQDVDGGTTKRLGRMPAEISTTNGNVQGDIVIGDSQGNMSVVSKASGQMASKRCGPDLVSSLEISERGDVVVCGTSSGLVCTWHVPSGLVLKRMGHVDQVTSVAVLPDATGVVSGAMDGDIRIWTLPLVPDWSNAKGASLMAATWSSDGSKAAFSGTDGVLFLYDAATGKSRDLVGHESLVRGIDFSPDGRQLISGAWDDDVRLWDTETGNSRVLKGHSDDVHDVKIFADAVHAMSIGEDGRVLLWDTRTGGSREIAAGGDPMRILSMAPSRHVAVAGSSKGRVILVHDEDYVGRELWASSTAIRGAAISKDGTLIAIGSENGELIVIRLRGGEVTFSVRLDEAVQRVAFDEEARQIVVGSDTGVMTICEVQTHVCRLLGRHDAAVRSMTFLRDGRLVSSGMDDSIRVWNTTSGAMRSYRGGWGSTTMLAVTADERSYASASWDGFAIVDRVAILQGPSSTLREFQSWLLAITSNPVNR